MPFEETRFGVSAITHVIGNHRLPYENGRLLLDTAPHLSFNFEERVSAYRVRSTPVGKGETDDQVEFAPHVRLLRACVDRLTTEGGCIFPATSAASSWTRKRWRNSPATSGIRGSMGVGG